MYLGVEAKQDMVGHCREILRVKYFCLLFEKESH